MFRWCIKTRGSAGINAMDDGAFGWFALVFFGLELGVREWTVVLMPGSQSKVVGGVLEVPWGSSCECLGSGSGFHLAENGFRGVYQDTFWSTAEANPIKLIFRGTRNFASRCWGHWRLRWVRWTLEEPSIYSHGISGLIVEKQTRSSYPWLEVYRVKTKWDLLLDGYVGDGEMFRPMSAVDKCAAWVPNRDAFDSPVGLGVVRGLQGCRKGDAKGMILGPQKPSLCRGHSSVNNLIHVIHVFLATIWKLLMNSLAVEASKIC